MVIHSADKADKTAELGEILAVGLQRLSARQSSQKPADLGESSLHVSPDQSVCHSETSNGDGK
jgi:hypothetical protein